MVKIIIVILFITAISCAQNIPDYRISYNDKEKYYQILLKKWHNSDDYQNSTNCHECMSMYEIFDMIEKTLKKDYDIDSYKLCESMCVGEQCEYDLTVARELSDEDRTLIIRNSPDYNSTTVRELANNEQIWILYSRKLKKVVSTYKDKRWQSESVKPSR